MGKQQTWVGGWGRPLASQKSKAAQLVSFKHEKTLNINTKEDLEPSTELRILHHIQAFLKHQTTSICSPGSFVSVLSHRETAYGAGGQRSREGGGW